MSSLIFAATCDLAGKVRGKAFPAEQLAKRQQRGVGWTPTNVQINCFDGIAASPFGALGDLLLIPDVATEVPAQFSEFDEHSEHFMLGDITTLGGEPWDFCTRSILKAALARLERVSGLSLLAAFEHEFQIKSARALTGEAYGLAGFEAQRELLTTLIEQIDAAGLQPDSIMKEYGPHQYEVVIGPEIGVRAADAAVIVRELTRASARYHGEKATFTPIADPASVGNGVHIHMSLRTKDGKPATYDPDGPCGMAPTTAAFVAGVLRYLNSIVAFTAPSVISYQRLTPHRWSAAYNNLGFRDREASLRVCPVTASDPEGIARQFNIEYRAADAAACPHLALAAIVHAGAQGIEDKLSAPEATEEDLSLLSAEQLSARGLTRLPETLELALAKLSANATVKSWFAPEFVPVYCAHKQSEIDHVKAMTIAEQCQIYQETY